MPSVRRKKLEEIELIKLDMPDGSQQDAYSLIDAAAYLDISPSQALKIFEKNDIERWERGYGNTKYVLLSDLDKLKRARPAKD
jgi:hypothetical protein